MQFKLISITLLTLFFVLINTCDGREEMIKQSQFDAEVYNFLGTEVVNFINASDSIRLLHLDPTTDIPNRKKFMDFDVVKSSDILNNKQRDSLLHILRSTKSYRFKEFEKSCAFLPNYAFAFLGKNKKAQLDTLSVLLDLNCDMWVFKYHDETKHEYIVNVANDLDFLLDDISISNKATTAPKTIENTTMETISSYLERKYGEEIISETLASDNVSGYLLDPQKSADASSHLFHGYVVLDSTPIPKKHKAHTFLLRTLQDKKIETESRFIKNCTFLPDAAFSFKGKDDESLDLLISFYCNDLLIVFKEGQSIVDCELLRNDLLDTSLEAFPNDEFLKKYFNE